MWRVCSFCVKRDRYEPAHFRAIVRRAACESDWFLLDDNKSKAVSVSFLNTPDVQRQCVFASSLDVVIAFTIITCCRSGAGPECICCFA